MKVCIRDCKDAIEAQRFTVITDHSSYCACLPRIRAADHADWRHSGKRLQIVFWADFSAPNNCFVQCTLLEGLHLERSGDSTSIQLPASRELRDGQRRLDGERMRLYVHTVLLNGCVGHYCGVQVL